MVYCSKCVACSSGLLRRASIVCYSVILFYKDTSVVGGNQEGANFRGYSSCHLSSPQNFNLTPYIATREN